MDKNVPVDQSASSSIGVEIPSATQAEQKTTSVPVKVTSAFSSDIQKSDAGDSDRSLPILYSSSSSHQGAMISTSSSTSKSKVESNQLDTLVNDLLSEVNQPVPLKDDRITSASSYSFSQEPSIIKSEDSMQTKVTDFDSSTDDAHRTKIVREERIRIKRGTGMEIPQTTTTTTTTTTTNSSSIGTKTATKPTIETSLDEELIDSLLESVQNTLRKRAQYNVSASNNVTQMQQGPSNRRAYSTSSAYADSVHRMDPTRNRYPIKLNRTDSPTSTLSSRRAYSRQESRDGYISGSTTTIPTHFRATSEPPPEGPIELRRMDLRRSPSRPYFDPYPQEYHYYTRSTLPPRGYRSRTYDYSGYDTDTGPTAYRVYPPRYYRVPPPPPPPPVYPYFPPRPMFRPDGYDTDSGLISSGRVHMTRTMPSSASRMDVIPETTMVHNRMASGSYMNTLPSHLRANVYSNQRYGGESFNGYETDSGMNTRYSNTSYRRVPIHVGHADQGYSSRTMPQSPRYQDDYEQTRTTSIPVVTQASQQEKRMESHSSSSLSAKKQTNLERKDISILPRLFPGSVGLSNPIVSQKTQQQQQPQPQQRTSESERKYSITRDQSIDRSVRSQDVPIHTDHQIPSSTDLFNISKTEHISSSSEITPTMNISVPVTKITTTTTTSSTTNQTYNTNAQTRIGNGVTRNPDENSRRSSLTSAAESDVQRTGAYQAHNVSQFWYKEKMSREDAINTLKSRPPGTFLIRDSQGFPGSFGLAVKVATLPPGIQPKPGADPNGELVRHYLIERTATGHVRLKGCPNEPEFASLSALVYHHTLHSLALPIKLVLPNQDFAENIRTPAENKKMTIKELLEKGAACNVLYLNNVDVESLSGQVAVTKALKSTFEKPESLQAMIVNFKVSNSGITLIDTKKKLFSRRHFPKENVTYCGGDYEEDRFWTYQYNDVEMLPKAKCFAFVSKKTNGNRSSNDNECHVFAEVDPTQPASAIVNFVSKVMIGSVPV